MAKITVLSQSDIRVLKQWIEDGKNTPRSTAVRTPLDMQWMEGMDGGSGEFYIVVADETIDPYEPDGSVIHNGMCRPLRKRIDTATLEEYLTETGEQLRVFNTLTTTINAGDILTVGKEKFGVWAPMGGGGAGGIHALVVSKTTKYGASAEVRGKYRCHEIEWLENGTWREKLNGRIFTNCYESSTNSNANIQLTKTNIVFLIRVSPAVQSSSSMMSSAIASSGGSGSSSAVHDNSLYVFEKALGGILHPVRI